MKYSPFEIKQMLDSFTVLVDTREQPNRRFMERTQGFNAPWVRHKLDFGDYSCMYTDLDGNEISLQDYIAVERKMDGNELALCFGAERKRFEREFQRANECGAKVYLLIEGENWEKLYAGLYGSSARYRSKMKPESLTASIHAFQARYNLNLQFCKPETTGKLIADILKYELRERLENEE